MTRKNDGHDAFIKFSVDRKAWDAMLESCHYYDWSRAELLRMFVLRWNEEWAEKKKELGLDSSETQLPEEP